MSKDKCKYCRWRKIADSWIPECTNKNSEFCGEECIEQQGDDSEHCDDRGRNKWQDE